MFFSFLNFSHRSEQNKIIKKNSGPRFCNPTLEQRIFVSHFLQSIFAVIFTHFRIFFSLTIIHFFLFPTTFWIIRKVWTGREMRWRQLSLWLLCYRFLFSHANNQILKKSSLFAFWKYISKTHTKKRLTPIFAVNVPHYFIFFHFLLINTQN